MLRFRRDTRAVSPTVSQVLLLAIVVIAAGAVGTYVFGIGDKSLQEPVPDASFSFDYNTENGNLKITYTGGDGIDPANVHVDGPRVSGSKFTRAKFGEKLTAGDSVTIPFAQIGDEYQIRWKTTEQSAVLARYTPPSGIDYIFDYSPTADDDGVSTFTSKFTVDTEQNIWYESSEGIRIDESSSGTSEGRWVADIDQTRNITLDVEMNAQISGATGVEMYAVDTNGNTITVFCQAGNYDSEFTCNGGSFTGTDRTYTVSSTAPIDKVVIHYKTDNGWEPVWVHEVKIAT